MVDALGEPQREAIAPQDVWACADHAFLYYHPTYVPQISWLWAGSEREFSTKLRPVQSQFATLKAAAFNLSQGTEPLHVYRVVSPQLVPITFGADAGHYLHHTLSKVDPRMREIPHYFA